MVFVAVLVSALRGLDRVGGQIPPYGGAAELRADLAARRANAMAALGPESVLSPGARPPKVYSTDVNYEYRQESNMLYLSGMTQEDTILVLIPGAKTKGDPVHARSRIRAASTGTATR